MNENTKSTFQISADSAHAFAVDVLIRANVPSDRATIIADSLVLADLRGVDTHGINRLPGYIARVQARVLDPAPSLTFQQKTPVMASLDAQNTFGFVAGRYAIDHAVIMAESFGVGIVGVKNSGHFGMAATYLIRAIEKGYAAFVFTNASRSMPAWGSKEPLFGTSPFAVGFPGGQKGDFILDMSPSVVARVGLRFTQILCRLTSSRAKFAKQLEEESRFRRVGCWTEKGEIQPTQLKH